MRGIGLIAILLLLVAASACRKDNANYCPGVPEDMDCPLPDGGGSCGDDNDCRAPTPVCNTDEQTCVECTQDEHCRAEAPICDLQDNTCVQCVAHRDCDSELCLDTGFCADAADVSYVSATGASSSACSKDMPCSTLRQALGPEARRKYIKITGAITDFVETDFDGVTLPGGTAIVYGEPGMSSLTRSMDGQVLEFQQAANVTFFDLEIKGSAVASDGLLIRDNSTVTLIRSRLSGHTFRGAILNTGSLTLVQSEVVSNGMFGLDVLAGALSIQGSWIHKNRGNTAIKVAGATSMVTIESSVIAGNTGTGGGLSIDSEFSITNTVIAGNGDAQNGTVGGAAIRSQSGMFAFNTVANNVAGTGGTSGIFCSLGAPAITNSIVKDNDIDPACAVQYSLTDTGLPAGMNNKPGDPKFDNTTDPLNPRYYRIQRDSAAKDSADPAATIEKDIDGDLRPALGKDLGADEHVGP